MVKSGFGETRSSDGEFTHQCHYHKEAIRKEKKINSWIRVICQQKKSFLESTNYCLYKKNCNPEKIK